MGAHHALAAYRLYASKVPATSLSLLVYMALVAQDRTDEPWWSQGHDTLARHALGRPEPVTEQDEEADARAVRRAITPLFRQGAITTLRRSSGRGDRRAHVRYRLWLTEPAPDEKRPVDTDSSADGNRPARSVSVGRNVVERRTKSVQTQDENRPPKEYEEDEELFKGEDETGDRRTPRTGGGVPGEAVEPIVSYDTTTRNGTSLAAMAAADALREWERQMAARNCPVCLCDPSTPNGAIVLATCRQAACPLTAAAAS